MKLKDRLPIETYDFENVQRFAEVEVIKEYESFNKRWIGKHKNVHIWFVLENGYAIGWNESPSRGWSFPVVKYSI